MLQPVGGMDRIAAAIYEQVKPACAAQFAGHGDPPQGDRVRIEHGPGKKATEADFAVVTLAGQPARADPERFLAGQEGGAQGHQLSAEREGRVRGAALLGDGWRSLRRARLDRPAERECHLPVRAASCRPRACWSPPMSPAGPTRTIRRSFAALSDAERFRISRESIEALHPGQVAAADQGRDGRLGQRSLFGGRRRAVGRRTGRHGTARTAICRAAEARRPDFLRRRTSILCRPVAGRRGACRRTRRSSCFRRWPPKQGGRRHDRDRSN